MRLTSDRSAFDGSVAWTATASCPLCARPWTVACGSDVDETRAVLAARHHVDLLGSCPACAKDLARPWWHPAHLRRTGMRVHRIVCGGTDRSQRPATGPPR